MNTHERLISEAIKPVVATCDTARMAVGEPGLPEEFVWRGQTVKIVAVLSTWRETGKCRHGSPERYVRKHWFEVDTASFGPMKIYFDRQPREVVRVDDGGSSASAAHRRFNKTTLKAEWYNRHT